MKKLFSILFLLLITFTVTACSSSDGKDCQHRDKNDDGKCDKCDEDYSDDKDIIVACQHRDADDNGKCEKCGADYTDGTDVVYSAGLEFVSNNDGTCFVKGIGICTETNLYIPPTSPDGDMVTSIGEYAFLHCSNITNIVIPSNVISIGAYAFNWCSNLTNITIPNNVVSIGAYAFSNCSSLISISIPDSVSSIGEFTFGRCSNLMSVTIGNSVGAIDNSAFDYCYRLVEVINKSALPIVANSSDYGKVAYYAKEVHTGKSKIVNENGYFFYTFDDINYLVCYKGNNTELVLPQNYNGKCYEIHKYAFNDSDIKSIIIPESVTKIGISAFDDCSNIKSITIPNSVISIEKFAFWDCSGLTNVTIGNSVTSIGYFAFNGCSALTDITISKSVTTIESDAFGDCPNLKKVYYKGTASDWNIINIKDYNSDLTSATRYYYSETTPTAEGNYWHYDANGEIEIWP